MEWKLIKRPRADWTCDDCRQQFSRNVPYWYRKVANAIKAERAFGIEKLCCGCHRMDYISERTLCEVCEAPATCAVRDQTRRLKDGVYDCQPDGEPHYLCDEHKRDSETIDVTSWYG